MSSLQQDPSGNFHICFRFLGKRFKRSLKTKNEKKASASLVKLDERIWMIESGHLELPANVDFACNKEKGWCKSVQQEFTVWLNEDESVGMVNGRSHFPGGRGGARQGGQGRQGAGQRQGGRSGQRPGGR